MSKYVIISDLHVKNSQGSDNIIEGLPESIYWPLQNLRKASEVAREKEATLVIAGDVNDSKRLVSQQVITETIQILEEVGQLVPTILVLGNHDYELYNGKVYSYLLNLVNVQVVLPNQPLVIDNVGFVAYNYDRELLLKDFLDIGYNELKMIISHFGLQEGKLSGSEYRTGEFSLKDFILNPKQYLILGHYHKPQKVSDNVFYVGSAIPTKINEIGEKKRMLYIDLDKDIIEEIPTEYPNYSILSLDEKSRVDIDEIRQIINKDIYRNKFIIYLQQDHPQFLEVKKLRDEFPSNIHIIVLQKVKDVEQAIKEVVSISKENLLKEYLLLLGITDIDKYIEVFNETMQEAG